MSQGSSLGLPDENIHSESGEQRRGHGRCAAAFGVVGGGEDIPVDEEKEVEEPSLSRQQSAASDDVEAAPHEGVRRRRIPPREASEEMDNSSALSVHSVTPLYPAPPQRGEPDVTHDPNDRAPWPGSEFKIAQVLPDSVYLWACGEHEGDQGLAEKSVSTAGCVAAWVVLITQAVCYAGLWYVSGNHPNTESQPSNSDAEQPESDADYSILAIAGAMYLLLSIAAADLWGGVALCLEGGDLRDVWFRRRKMFGVCLLGTFVTLIGASIRVLFYSSFENVDLVLGAAAVLFIADVDEKAMVVLKNVSDRWRLFWVLEAIGLSLWLAVVGIKATGNGALVDRNDCNSSADGDYPYPCRWGGHELLYGWYFIIYQLPITVTACTLLVTSIFSTPRSPLTRRPLVYPREPGRVVFVLLMPGWVLMGFVSSGFPSRYLNPFVFYFRYFDYALIGVAVAFGVPMLLLACYYRTELISQLSGGCGRGRTEVIRHTRKWVLWGWVLVFVSVFLFDLIRVVNALLHSGYGNDSDSSTVSAVFEGLHYILYLAQDALLISGMLKAGMRPVGGGTPRMRWMLLGWFFWEGCNAMFVILYLVFPHHRDFSESLWNIPLEILLELFFPLCWRLTVGVFLWGEEADTYGVAFWIAATMIRNNVIGCAYTWVLASADGTVT